MTYYKENRLVEDPFDTYIKSLFKPLLPNTTLYLPTDTGSQFVHFQHMGQVAGISTYVKEAGLSVI